MDKVCSNCKIVFKAKGYMNTMCSDCREFFKLALKIRKNKHAYLKKVGKLKCKQCGKDFMPKTLRQVYCSNVCVQANMRAKRKEIQEKVKESLIDVLKKEYGK